MTIICCNQILKHADPIQLWQDLLELRCPPPVEQDWHGVVEKIVTERVKGLTPEEQLDMLCELEDGSNKSSSCTLITNIFITESITSLEKLVFSQVSLITGISANCQCATTHSTYFCILLRAATTLGVLKKL